MLPDYSGPQWGQGMHAGAVTHLVHRPCPVVEAACHAHGERHQCLLLRSHQYLKTKKIPKTSSQGLTPPPFNFYKTESGICYAVRSCDMKEGSLLVWHRVSHACPNGTVRTATPTCRLGI